MWQRSELKQKAKMTFKKVYRKAVLVSFIAVILNGGYSEVFNKINDAKSTYNTSYYSQNYLYEYEDKFLDLSIQAENIIKDLLSNGFVLLFINTFIIVVILSLLIRLLIVYPIIVGKNNYFLGIRQEDKSIKNILFIYL